MLLFLGVGWAQDLELWIGQSRQTVDHRKRDSKDYYRLSDLGRFLGLVIQEEGDGRCYLRGPRGSLELLSNRPLVRRGEEYLLLNAPVWRRGRGDWWVPADFIEKLLPSILDQRLVPVRPGVFRSEVIERCRVAVSVHGRADRLMLVFTPDEPVEAHLREYRDYLQVSFEDRLIQAGDLERPDDQHLVADVTFDPTEGWGTFRVHKGPRFNRYRWYRSTEPLRYVLEIYGMPTVVAGTPSPSPTGAPEASAEALPDEVAGEVVLPSAVPRTAAIVIDPGHGGQDYGVDVPSTALPAEERELSRSEAATEKVVVLEVALGLEELLRGRGIPVELTRRRDVGLGDDQRAAVANGFQAEVFLSLHVGGAPSPALRGPVVYVFAPPDDLFSDAERVSTVASSAGPLRLVRWEEAQSEYLGRSALLAERLQAELNRLFEADNHVIRARLAVLAPIQAPAVLVELGFLTNGEDRGRLADPDFRRRLEETLADFLQEVGRE